MINLVIISMAVIYGLVFGSFANAVAYRIPTGETLLTRSHCPNCNAQIHAWQNIPILSWIILRGKCANCKNPISIQYPLVEFITAFLFGLIAWKIQNTYFFVDSFSLYKSIPFILVTIALSYYAFIGVVLSIIDLKTFTLPTKLIYPTLLFSVVLLSITALFIHEYDRLLWMLLGGIGSFVIFYILWFIFPSGIGYGDVRLVLLTGSILGWFSISYSILGLMLPFVLSTIVFVPLLILKKVTRKTKIPMGPWIILGSLITFLYGDIIINTYLSVGGFL